jgi:predicted thioesterase
LNSFFTQTIIVETRHTAEYLGSGFLPVFSTPAMIALMENTAIKCLPDLPEENSSVGISINVNHLKASPVGAIIHCRAEVTAIEGRRYTFLVRVTDDADNLIGEGTHERIVVNVEKFMSKI